LDGRSRAFTPTLPVRSASIPGLYRQLRDKTYVQGRKFTLRPGLELPIFGSAQKKRGPLARTPQHLNYLPVYPTIPPSVRGIGMFPLWAIGSADPGL
jgi:hypothetical protein